jgi:1-aminocyclopropane-1-carboxylate deaminase/D-cysteine desulfhydrase-like pyridoxal-dependent ACC family enzyme
MTIQRLPRLSEALGISLSVKRDDLFPFTGGGNKARKMVKIFEEAESMGCNAVVSVGGCQSNHARVVALGAAERGWPCKLILHGNAAALEAPRGNLLLMQLAGADIMITEADDIDASVKAAMSEHEAGGLTPFEVRGGGHCLAGGIAYFDAIEEISNGSSDSKPAWIVHASGTGSTQAGLVAGVANLDWETHVIGISVSRPKPRGTQAVEEICDLLSAHFDLGCLHQRVDFRDDWTCGGYEQVNGDILSAIKFAAETEGLVLDPTYTGKAFQGTLSLIQTGEIPAGAEVLFWHTGGLMNLQSYDFPVDALQPSSGTA